MWHRNTLILLQELVIFECGRGRKNHSILLAILPRHLKAKTEYDLEQSGNNVQLRFHYDVERRRGENLGDETRFLLGSKFHPSIIQLYSQAFHCNHLIYSG